MKRISAVILTLVVMVCAAAPAYAAKVIDNGMCGANHCHDSVRWLLYDNHQVNFYTLDGNYYYYDMMDFSLEEPAPWGNEILYIKTDHRVHSIGAYAFYGCVDLIDYFGSPVAVFGEYAFAGCSSIEEFFVPYLTDLGEGAFSGCKSLKTVWLDKITSIGDNAFAGCDSLTEIRYKGSEDDWKNVKIGSGNEALKNATIYYNGEYPESEAPTTEPPATEKPTTKPPATETPTTEPPATETPTEKPTEAPALIGDVNQNGTLDAGDATMILRHVVGSGKLKKAQQKLADVNQNGGVDAGDATMVLRIVVGAA